MQTRRHFLALLAGAVPLALRGTSRPRDRHPEPRPGIDASRVLPASRLTEHPDAIAVFDMVREIPQVVDGIRCQCGCSDVPDKYSLLSCFEGDGMAQDCVACKGQARLAHRLHRADTSLAAIRVAIEREFGG